VVKQQESSSAAASELNILLYHSISHSSGPTSISPDTFKNQLDILKACGYQAISLDALRSWHAGEKALPARSVLITFDDGLADFAESAFPILKVHHCAATVFLPSGRMGGTEKWEGIDCNAPRRLMSWSQVTDLAKENIDFGGHSVTHADLTKLSLDELQREVRQSREDIEDRIGHSPLAFATPYGRCRRRERDEIRKWFDLSLGTKLSRASRHCDRYDLPRIEMHYFRNLKRWREFVDGRGELYFFARRLLRSLKRPIL